MPVNSIIIGVDLAPIKPIPRCITFQSDITTDKCRSTIRSHLKTWKADTVLHDGAPNVGTAWVQDAFSQAELVLQSLKLATEFLVKGGTFVTKIFRSKDYNSLLWVFNQLFTKVEATKPPSSRNVSAEIFVICRGYKAPKRIDPKFLDPRSVFAELSDPTPNNEAKVFNPEKKKRRREGYEEGDWTQYKEAPASDFIQTTDPIAMLGTLNKLSFEQNGNGDLALATLDKLPETTQEIRDCCVDLKVLGRKEFRLLLKWRLRVREIFGFSEKKQEHKKEKEQPQGEEVAEVESMDEELKIQEALQGLKDQVNAKRKKERRKENEKRQKEIVRMQMGMTTPFEIGLEQSGDAGMFSLKPIDKAGTVSQFSRGRMHTLQEPEPTEEVEEEDEWSDSDGDALERQLDAMYEEYQERKSAQDAKYRAKRQREEHEDGEWQGVSDKESESSEGDNIVEDYDSDASSDSEEKAAPAKVISAIGSNTKSNGGLTRRAAMFFDQDIFKGIDALDADEDSGIDVAEKEASPVEEHVSEPVEDVDMLDAEEERPEEEAELESEADTGFEVVKQIKDDDDWGEEQQAEPMKNGRPDIDIITAEAMTLAHQLATGTKTKADLLDEGFNKYSLRDTEGLPEWFLDDERKHSKPLRPITAAAARAIKEKLRALNARPIKKVREAKDRKKLRAAQRLEKLRKKSALLLEDEGMSEGDKTKAIAKMMARAAKKKPKRRTTVVVARAGNRGISGRPRGTKGRYKMVDARLKKDVRAEKRLKKAGKR